MAYNFMSVIHPAPLEKRDPMNVNRAVKSLISEIGDISMKHRRAMTEIDKFKDSMKDQYIEMGRLNEHKMTLTEVDKLMAIYSMPHSQRFKNVEDQKLGNYIVKDIPFFIKFIQKVRIDIMRNSELCLYKRGYTIFHEGDVGDCMYIILLGSVNVRKVVENMTKTEKKEIVRKIQI